MFFHLLRLVVSPQQVRCNPSGPTTCLPALAGSKFHTDSNRQIEYRTIAPTSDITGRVERDRDKLRLKTDSRYSISREARKNPKQLVWSVRSLKLRPILASCRSRCAGYNGCSAEQSGTVADPGGSSDKSSLWLVPPIAHSRHKNHLV